MDCLRERAGARDPYAQLMNIFLENALLNPLQSATRPRNKDLYVPSRKRRLSRFDNFPEPIKTCFLLKMYKRWRLLVMEKDDPSGPLSYYPTFRMLENQHMMHSSIPRLHGKCSSIPLQGMCRGTFQDGAGIVSEQCLDAVVANPILRHPLTQQQQHCESSTHMHEAHIVVTLA